MSTTQNPPLIVFEQGAFKNKLDGFDQIVLRLGSQYPLVRDDLNLIFAVEGSVLEAPERFSVVELKERAPYPLVIT
jgi:hypothetical protein